MFNKSERLILEAILDYGGSGAYWGELNLPYSFSYISKTVSDLKGCGYLTRSYWDDRGIEHDTPGRGRVLCLSLTELYLESKHLKHTEAWHFGVY